MCSITVPFICFVQAKTKKGGGSFKLGSQKRKSKESKWCTISVAFLRTVFINKNLGNQDIKNYSAVACTVKYL